MNTILIVGATSDIAAAAAREFAANGWHVGLAARRRAETALLAADLAIRYPVQTEPFYFDALDASTHERALREAIERFGRLDGILLCYGYLGHPAATDRLSFDEIRKVVDINYVSCIHWLEHAAAYFETQGSGRIAAISSVAGDRGRQSNYLYGSAKGALSLYMQGLRNRLSRKGIAVTTIKPGWVDTKMTHGQPGSLLMASPERVARGIYRAIDKRRNIAYTPSFWRWIMLIIRCIPESLFKRMSL